MAHADSAVLAALSLDEKGPFFLVLRPSRFFQLLVFGIFQQVDRKKIFPLGLRVEESSSIEETQQQRRSHTFHGKQRSID